MAPHDQQQQPRKRTTMATSTTTTTPTVKPRIRVLGPARYLVESSSRPGLGHQVDVLRLRCGCEAGRYGRRCRHLVLAIQYDAWRRRQMAQAAPASSRQPAPFARPAEPERGAQPGQPKVGMAALQEAF